MVNTEPTLTKGTLAGNYNILNIVVNTEPALQLWQIVEYYNILNIVVNTEQHIWKCC